ncbi:tuberin-like, partial [Saccoglossus kowalevskii]
MGCSTDDLIELVVLPQLTHIIDDEDVEVRNEAIQLLVGVALDCQTQHAMDIMNIFEKLISRPMGSHVTPPTSPEVSDSRLSKQHLNQLDDAQLVDIKTAILGLLQIFKNKLFMLPSIHAIRAFELVSRHAKTHYKNDYHSDLASSIRYEIFHCLLQLRADMLHRLGFPDKDGVIRYSHYLLVKDSSGSPWLELALTSSSFNMFNMFAPLDVYKWQPILQA